MSQSDKPLISVITPCYNAAEHIGESVASVFAQTYDNLELVVVDDGSGDDSLALLETLRQQDARLRIVSQPNSGAGPARNRGLREARGEFIAFLDADDYWEPDCLEKLHQALADGKAELAYCGWQNTGLSTGRSKPFIPPDYAQVDKAELLLGGNRWPIHAALTRRRAIDAVDGFDERLSSCMDYDLWLRIASFVEIVRVPEVLAYYRHHGDAQITSNRARIAINHWLAQRWFLQQHPEIAKRLGRRRVRQLCYGELLERGYVCYWKRDLEAARRIFREVMKAGYGGPRDWKYMLPGLLPLPLHRGLIKLLERPGKSRS